MTKTWMLAGLLGCMLAPATAAAQLTPPFTDPRWDLRGDSTRVESIDGRQALTVESGAGVWRDAAFLDGTIDVDVQFTPRRSFLHIQFRMVADGEYEEVYLRPHKSGLPDAVQYAPVFQGMGAWQFYHGPGATASPVFAHGTWTHVRLVVKGTQAALFIDDMQAPALVVPRLGRAPARGAIALRAFLPPDVPGSGPIARYANVAVRHDDTPFDFSRVAVPTETEPGAITAWRTSQAVPTAEGDDSVIPRELLAGESRVLQAEPNGRLILHRDLRMPKGSRDVTTAARVRLRAAAAGTRRLDLGFSDAATVFLNGQPIFRGDARYSFDRPRQEGLVGYGQASVFLALKAGDNDLVVIVSDAFGGWGLMGRIVDRRGLVIEPSPGS